LRDRFHRLDRLEELHADRNRAQPKIPVQSVDDRVPVIRLHDTLHSELTNYSAVLRSSEQLPPRTIRISGPAAAGCRAAAAWWGDRRRAPATAAAPGADAAARAASDLRRALSRSRPSRAGRRPRPP